MKWLETWDIFRGLYFLFNAGLNFFYSIHHYDYMFFVPKIYPTWTFLRSLICFCVVFFGKATFAWIEKSAWSIIYVFFPKAIAHYKLVYYMYDGIQLSFYQGGFPMYKNFQATALSCLILCLALYTAQLVMFGWQQWNQWKEWARTQPQGNSSLRRTHSPILTTLMIRQENGYWFVAYELKNFSSPSETSLK